MPSEITHQERSALDRLRGAIEAGEDEAIRQEERALLDVARGTGSAEVWEAWAFLSTDTANAVQVALKREREAITRRLEALYADPNTTWNDILAVATEPEEPEASAGG